MKSRLKILGICILIIGCVFYYNKYIKIRNVFDEMYYTRVHDDFNYFNPGNFNGLFGNMPQLQVVGRDEENMYTSEGYFIERYLDEYLEKNNSLVIYFNKNRKKMTISYYFYHDNCRELYQYVYDVRKKTLSYVTYYYEGEERSALTNKLETEEKKNYMYTRFLTDWFEANKGKTRFSMDNLGKFKMVEKEQEETNQ